MTLPQSLTTLATYLAGEFDNHEQAIAEPAWFVHLRLWHRPTRLFAEDSITLFAEQANIYTLNNPYRQRLLRLHINPEQPDALKVQYYAFKDPQQVKGAGQNPQLLEPIDPTQLELLPGCQLLLQQEPAPDGGVCYLGTPPAGARCCFNYQNEIRQVVLGFESTANTFASYDKGVDPETGKALWGALMGPYRFTKQKAYPLIQ